MAKKSKHGRGKERRQAARAEKIATAPVAPTAPVEEPAFWFGFEVTWAKLLLARVVFFALLALDALLNYSHAPRYGAGDFNVAQLAIFDPIAPGRAGFAIGQLVCAYAFVLVACGVATRWVLPVATAIYGWLYFGSQLDSYQHHYLVWLILVLACFVPWEGPASAVPATRIRSWAMRLILVQLGILYLWAAISKCNSAWFDGSTLSQQIHGSLGKLIESTVKFKVASSLVVLTEFTLAATIWNKRAWWIAAPLGLALHIGILWTGFEIGLFAWLMIGLYILVIPDRLWVAIGERLPRIPALPGRWAVFGVSVAMSVVLAFTARFDYARSVGIVLLIATMGLAIRVRPVAKLGVASLCAFLLWTVVDRSTSTAADYYRFWGGSSRRLGDPKTAEHAYRRMTEVAPTEGSGHYQLGRLLLARGDESGVAELERAQQLEPLKARAYVAEARWLATHGRRDEAIAKAREATIVEPSDSEARSLLDSLVGGSR
jgi:tetratricopeptide (TPR) repeat protein